MMVGRRDRPAVPQARRPRSARRCWRCATWSRRRWCAGVSLTVRAGEIVGLAGLVGSGPQRAGAERVRHHAGRVAARSWSTASRCGSAAPPQAKRHGIAYVPEDRGTPGPGPADDRAPERVAGRAAPDRAARLHRPRPRRRLADDAIARFGIRARGLGPDRGQAVGRQPAEGRARQVAGDQAARC